MSEYTKICEQAVRAGGAEVVDWIERFDVQKKGPADLVTQADLASQEAIRRTVLGAFPHHSLLAERWNAAGSCSPAPSSTRSVTSVTRRPPAKGPSWTVGRSIRATWSIWPTHWRRRAFRRAVHAIRSICWFSSKR